MAGYDRRPFMTMTQMRMWMRMSKEIIKPRIIKMKYRKKRREWISSCFEGLEKVEEEKWK